MELPEAEPALPPEPTLPPPPQNPEDSKDGLTAKELKILSHLKELQKEMELDASLQQQLEQLEEKQKTFQTAKSLSHGHINKLSRAKQHVATALKKLQDMDKEWEQLRTKAMDKLRQHAIMYKAARKELLETYQKRCQEKKRIEEELSQASKNLLENAEVLDVEEMPDLDEQMQAFCTQMQELDAVNIISDEDTHPANDLEMETEDPDGKENGTGKAGKAKTHFIGSPSPSRVANHHLKPKVRTKVEKPATWVILRTNRHMLFA